jgi:hypothetical protein
MIYRVVSALSYGSTALIVCVVLCTVFRLIVVLLCVLCVVCVLCLIVVPLPPGENPFAVKINTYLSIFNLCLMFLVCSMSHNYIPLGITASV